MRESGRLAMMVDSLCIVASYETTQSAISKGKRRVPQIPEEGYDGDQFSCQVCHHQIVGITDRASWKKHVFNDLAPYTCIREGCHTSAQYESTASWIEHDTYQHTEEWKNRSCPFCGPGPLFDRNDKQNYYKHISRHLQDISLAALSPMSHDEDDESEDSETEPVNSTSDAILHGEKSVLAVSVPSVRGIACPFNKFDRKVFQTCRGSQFRSMADIRTHLSRRHSQSKVLSQVQEDPFQDPKRLRSSR
ncbi:hypothetical protein QBC35DRAFT_478389 [Podospora australis]|uniref:Oxidoreductase acuF-like C2H2 type zinc-finger domain-containing protein n=1 Tax=Podospora australis TaxID=1536484 RepID=A0AAN7ADI4_9PEZI|nr:hypothetical protein QBC35DRAFT_478389 [Podospora australis]